MVRLTLEGFVLEVVPLEVGTLFVPDPPTEPVTEPVPEPEPEDPDPAALPDPVDDAPLATEPPADKRVVKETPVTAQNFMIFFTLEPLSCLILDSLIFSNKPLELGPQGFPEPIGEG